MKKSIIGIGTLLLLVSLLGVPALAQGVSEAAGKVVDRDGNPVKGAKVSFVAKSKPDVPYTGDTNKKGRYYIPNLFTGKADEFWVMSVEAEGLLPVEIRVESRTVNRVLVGDIMTVDLSRGKKAPEIPIRPLGKATVDWKMAPSEEIEQGLRQLAAARAAEETAADGSAAAAEVVAAEPAKDPWVEALTLASAGNLEDSLEFFDKAVEREEENAERHETYAKVLFQLERNDEAEVQAKRAVELEPSRLDAHMLMYSIYDARGDMAAARAAVEAARDVMPDNTRVLKRLGYVAFRQGDEEAAVEAYGKVTEIDPANAEAWMALANIHTEAGRLAESEAAYQALVGLDPENAHQTYYNLGALILKRDDASQVDVKRAIDAFRRAIEVKPDYAKAYKELGSALLRTGDQPGALEAYRKYVRLKPDAADAPSVQALIGALEKRVQK